MQNEPINNLTKIQRIFFAIALVLFVGSALQGIFKYYNISFSLSRGFGAAGYGTIQGFKVKGPGIDQTSNPPSAEAVYLDGKYQVATNPYFFTNVVAGTHIVSVSVPVGWSVGYTLCYNKTTCHLDRPTPGKSVKISLKAGGYADLWWHYTPPVSNPPNSVTVLTPNGGERLVGDKIYLISINIMP